MTHSSQRSAGTSLVEPAPSTTELVATDQLRRSELRPAGNGWRIWRSTGSANVFHHYRPETSGHEIWVRTLDRPALVLGSTQSETILNPASFTVDMEVCRRRSGGGLVLLDPERDLWVDVLVPSQSPMWDDDVARSFDWLGQSWARTLGGLLPAAEVESHRQSAGPDGRVLCFASIGHGEVTVDGRKVVGLSQRRTRQWTRIQGVVVQHWPADLLSSFLAAGPSTPDPKLVAAGLPPGIEPISPAELIKHLLNELPDVNGDGTVADG